MNIVPFDFSGKTVRILTDDKGDFWWVAAEVCAVLGLNNVTMALVALDQDDKKVSKVDVGSKSRRLINEPGLYSLIIRSNKKRAKKFKRWITHDILPTIRKTGSYSIKKQLPQTYAETLRALANEVEKNEKNAPKVEYYKNVALAVNAHSFNRAAKILGWGRNTLMKTLRDDKVLMESNMPYQRHLNANRFQVKESSFEIQGVKHITSTTFVTGKGMQWLSQQYNTRIQMEMFA